MTRPLLALLALACTDPPATVVEPCEQPLEARIVVPEEGFTMVHGPQGGWHVWVAAELAGNDSSVVLADVTITAAEVVSEGPENLTTIDLHDAALGTYDEETCTGSFSQAWAYLNDGLPEDEPWRGICDLAGQELTVELTVFEVDDTASAHATATGPAVLDPVDEGLCAD